jgi:hypothetical protein
MRKLMLAAAFALACAMLGGCNLTTASSQLSTDEQKVIAIVEKIKAGAAVAIADVENASNFICGNLPAAATALTQAQNVLAGNAKATPYLTVANASLAGVTAYCNGSRGSGPQIILSAWTGLKAGQAAINSASGAAGQ